MSELKVVHYLNQYFAGVGGEERAGEPPQVRPGFLGPGCLLQEALGEAAQVVATVHCGDNFFNEQPEAALAAILDLIAAQQAHVLVAGPAFAAGRYGLACGQVCAAAQERLGVPAVTAMHPENPAADLYRARVYILPAASTAAGMAEAMRRLATLALKLARREPLGTPQQEGYLARGVRVTELAAENGGARAVAMLLKRLRGEVFESEWPIPAYDYVPAPPPIPDVGRATVALVTTGGIVPRGNPDGIESTHASKWLRYDIRGLEDLTPAGWRSVHGGYDTTRANEDPDRVLPLDAMRRLEAAGVFGRLHDQAYTTVGSGASLASARRFGREIAQELVAAQVDGVVLTAT